MKRFLSAFILFSIFTIFFTGCVRNTDFDQMDSIVITPVVELNLVYFDLDVGDFYDSISSTPILSVRDTTNLKFLNDSSITKNLKRVEFYFKFTNSMPQDFQVDFQFLSETNDTTYAAATSVAEGSLISPVVTEFIKNVEEDDISDLTKANKIVISVSIPEYNENLEGKLNLKSKATYFLEE